MGTADGNCNGACGTGQRHSRGSMRDPTPFPSVVVVKAQLVRLQEPELLEFTRAQRMMRFDMANSS